MEFLFLEDVFEIKMFGLPVAGGGLARFDLLMAAGD
jgi:hypothetical protein